MPRFEVISKSAINRRAYWVEEIAQLSGRFGEDTSRIEEELKNEVKRGGIVALVGHLRLCGSIPEHYGHDSSEEKLYSKYTDTLLSLAYRSIGLTSVVLGERADAADVEAVGADFSLVADAKAFRLSRTAKNQKDFKVEALHGWKRGKQHAMIVCPIFQLPARISQIYQQAISRNVCIFSYSHLSILVQAGRRLGQRRAQQLLLAVLRCAEELNPTKDSLAYWGCLNRTMLDFDGTMSRLWQTEKRAMIEGLDAAKEEALTYLAKERERIMRMTRQDAIVNLIRDRNIEGRETIVRSVGDNGILAIS